MTVDVHFADLVAVVKVPAVPVGVFAVAPTGAQDACEKLDAGLEWINTVHFVQELWENWFVLQAGAPSPLAWTGARCMGLCG